MAEREQDTPESSNDVKGKPIPGSKAQPGFVQASPPRFISLDELMDTSKVVGDLQILHEIAVDDEFRLKQHDPPAGSIEQQVADTVKRAFWDVLSERLSQTPADYSHAVVLIEDVKKKLLDCLMPQQQRLRNMINEVLDMQLIQQKVDNGAFDITYYADFVRGLMARFCAPVRDEEVAKLNDITDLVTLFKEIFRVLDLMQLDMINVKIDGIRSLVKEQSVTLERKKFDEFLSKSEAAGVDGLQYTREWLERSFEVLDEHTEGQVLFHTDMSEMNCTPANILHGACIDLLNWTDNVYPETWLMDQGRIMDIKYNLRKLTLISSTLLVAFSQMGDKLAGHTKFRDRLKAEMLAIMADVPEDKFPEKMVNVGEHVSQQVNAQLAVLGFDELNSKELTEYKEQLIATGDNSHHVHLLLWKRLMTFVWKSLSHNNSQPLQLPPGFGAVGGEITSFVGKFWRLATHNKAVFATRYADMVASFMNVVDLSPRAPTTTS